MNTPNGAVYAGAAWDYVQRQFGGLFTPAERVLTAGTAAAQLVPNNPERLNLILVNLSANSLYVGRDSQVSSTRGIYLAPLGGTLVLGVNEDAILPALDWWLLASGAASSVYMLELNRAVGG